MRYRLLTFMAVLLGMMLPVAPSGASEYWRCGPGPSVKAHVVPGGLEVTSVPPGTRRIKARIEHDLHGRGRHTARVKYPSALPVVIPARSGEYISALATGKWTRADPYPPLGCPTSPARVP